MAARVYKRRVPATVLGSLTTLAASSLDVTPTPAAVEHDARPHSATCRHSLGLVGSDESHVEWSRIGERVPWRFGVNLIGARRREARPLSVCRPPLSRLSLVEEVATSTCAQFLVSGMPMLSASDAHANSFR